MVMVILFCILFSYAYMHYAQSCHFVHLHEFNMAFACLLCAFCAPFKPDIEGRQGNAALEI